MWKIFSKAAKSPEGDDLLRFKVEAKGGTVSAVKKMAGEIGAFIKAEGRENNVKVLSIHPNEGHIIMKADIAFIFSDKFWAAVSVSRIDPIDNLTAPDAKQHQPKL